MASLNKVILIGNLGADPEVRFTGSGQAVANMRIATTEKWTSGEKSGEQTEWHKIVVFGKQAENCKQYLAKGRQIYVEGRLQTRQWDDRDGNKRYTTEVVAQRVLFLGSKSSSDTRPAASADDTADFTPPSTPDAAPGFPVDDEIPF